MAVRDRAAGGDERALHRPERQRTTRNGRRRRVRRDAQGRPRQRRGPRIRGPPTMPLRADLENSVDQIIKTPWAKRDGRVVPESDDSVKFIHDAVALDATFLYADLADSTALAQCDKFLAAEVFQAFLNSTSRVMLSEHGEIRSFAGDRVMTVF